MTPWTVAHRAPLSMGFPRQEYWRGLPFPSPGDLPDPGIKPASPAVAGGFFTIWASREALQSRHACYCQGHLRKQAQRGSVANQDYMVKAVEAGSQCRVLRAHAFAHCALLVLGWAHHPWCPQPPRSIKWYPRLCISPMDSNRPSLFILLALRSLVAKPWCANPPCLSGGWFQSSHVPREQGEASGSPTGWPPDGSQVGTQPPAVWVPGRVGCCCSSAFCSLWRDALLL